MLNWSAKNKRGKKRDREEPENVEAIDISELLGGIMGGKMSHKGLASDSLYTIDNNIYFQDDITMESISSLNREMRMLQLKLIDMGTSYNIEPPPIRLHLTTYGGSILAALSCIDCMGELKVDVHTICDGYVASAGTLISVCAKKRFIKKNASMLIHELRSSVWGKMTEIEDEYDNLKKMMDVIKNIYLKNTKLKKKELGEILKQDRNWDADECLEKGLVDEII